MKKQPGKVLSVRLSPKELMKMNMIARETQMSMGRLVKEAVMRFYSEGKGADLNQRILELESRIEELENDIAQKNAAIIGVKQAFSDLEEYMYFLDNEAVVY